MEELREVSTPHLPPGWEVTENNLVALGPDFSIAVVVGSSVFVQDSSDFLHVPFDHLVTALAWISAGEWGYTLGSSCSHVCHVRFRSPLGFRGGGS